MDGFPPLRTLAHSALQRVDPILTVGVGVLFYLQYRKNQQLDQRILAQDQTILAQGIEILNLKRSISKLRWMLLCFMAKSRNSASDAMQLRLNLLSTNVRLIQAEKRIVSLEDFKMANKPHVWSYAFTVSAHILRVYLGTYDLQKLLDARDDVYINLLQDKFSANNTVAEKKITEGLIRIISLRHDVAHPPPARLEMRALGPLIRTLETFQGEADVPKDIGLVINILSSKLLPR
jgi:hypothetical protein